ncbi:hypothetical protein TSUD_168920 [Trifolium subterraneum]|nr:hypothetical protein TSUD_168920 [Trifolium subterraneum]
MKCNYCGTFIRYDQGNQKLDRPMNRRTHWFKVQLIEPEFIFKVIEGINDISWRSSLKSEFSCLMENSNWLVGNGKDIKLWEDSWCGEPLIDTLQINNSDLTWLPSKASDILLNHSWNIPADLDNLFPTLKTIVRQVTLSNQNVPDKLIWKHNTSGELSMKDAYEFKRLKAPQKSWAKIIWCMEIPPSKSLLAWRLMQDKIPIDDKLMERGCNIPSMCSLCCSTNETTFHLFFTCNKTSMCSNSSLTDFRILKIFNISIHPPMTPCIKEVIWKPPCVSWVKCNSDGASTHLSSACGGIFRNHNAEFICCFAENTSLNTAYFAELCGAMKAVEIVADNNWSNLWLENDSSLVVLAFKCSSLVPWRLRNI